MNKKVLIITISFLLCSWFARGQEVIETEFKDPGAKNTEAELKKQDFKMTGFSLSDQANIQSMAEAFKQRNRARVTISSDLANQQKEVEKLLNKFKSVTASQGSSYKSLSPAAQIKYLAEKALIEEQFDQIKEDIKPYFEEKNLMTEGDRILLILKAIRRAAALVEIQ